MDGVIVIDKPEGYTSFDIVAIVRKLYKEKKVGHTGTLDPLATGALVVLLGKATKAQVFMDKSYKEYIAEFKLGISSDTQDITGNIIKRDFVKTIKSDIEKSILNFIGTVNQIPPMHSALKKDGIRLYEMARKGIEIERKPRNITIYGIELLEYDEELGEGKIKVKCSRGTYIRTLCADIGESLGYGAVMVSLRRTYTDGFSISESRTISELEILNKKGEGCQAVLKTECLFKNLGSIFITDAQKTRFLNGGSLMLSRVDIGDYRDEKVKIYFENEFLGLGKIDFNNNEVLVLKIFKRVIDL